MNASNAISSDEGILRNPVARLLIWISKTEFVGVQSQVGRFSVKTKKISLGFRKPVYLFVVETPHGEAVIRVSRDLYIRTCTQDVIAVRYVRSRLYPNRVRAFLH